MGREGTNDEASEAMDAQGTQLVLGHDRMMMA